MCLLEKSLSKSLFFSSKKYFISLLLHYFHSFCITVISFRLSSFLPVYCHSFCIIVNPSKLMSFLLNCFPSFHIIVIPSKLLPCQIFVILNSFCTLPYPKGEKIVRQSLLYLQVFCIVLTKNFIYIKNTFCFLLQL